MKIYIPVPWNQYGLITELAVGASKRDLNLGKTALQKHVYFLQTLHEIDCGYEFRLYTYGPFSAELLGDLDGVAGLGGVEVTYQPQVAGYSITPGPKSADIRLQAAEFLSNSSDAIDSVLDEFGRLTAKDLELSATIVYAEREAREMSGKSPEASSLVDVVRELKPHFSDDQIERSVERLLARSYIDLAIPRASANKAVGRSLRA
jgi:uncharacterized protein YwgA